MYLGVDVGGTKTLAAVLDDHGVIKERVKFPTPESYDQWLLELRHQLHHFEHKDFRAAGIAIPVLNFDRELGIARSFGNLAWKNEPVQDDLERVLGCPVVVENDAKLGGLSEAMLLKDTYDKILYVTISTGIGFSLIVNRVIDTAVGDSGGRLLMLEHKGKLVSWESFASGKAILDRYGKLAQDIDDEATWKRIAHDLALGFIELVALFEPEVIVVGGSVGTHFGKYGTFLKAELKKLETPLLPIPPIIGAQRPEEAVVYGCYDLAKQVYGSVARTA